MKQYLIISSRDPFESRSANNLNQLTRDLSQSGNRVTLFLIENGVFAARLSATSAELSKLCERGVTVLADSFSLRERGISDERLGSGIQPAAMDALIDELERGAQPMWF